MSVFERSLSLWLCSKLHQSGRKKVQQKGKKTLIYCQEYCERRVGFTLLLLVNIYRVFILLCCQLRAICFFFSLPTPGIVVANCVPAFGTGTRKQGGMKENMHGKRRDLFRLRCRRDRDDFRMQCVPAGPKLSVNTPVGFFFPFLKDLSWQRGRRRKKWTF